MTCKTAKKKKGLFKKTSIFVILLLISAYSDAQKKLPYILYNDPILKELFDVRGNIRAMKSTITEFQSMNAVNAKDGKETYTVTLNVNATKSTITQLSDKEKSNGYLIKNVYYYNKQRKPKSMKYYEDELKGNGWELKDEKTYTYSKDNINNYINRKISYPGPTPGETDQSNKQQITGLYDTNLRLLEEVDGLVKISYTYNKQNDILEKKVDAGENATGIYTYKYQYDTKGNWIKKEEYDTSGSKKNLLVCITKREIAY